jgi:hypothetical protein
MSPSAGALGHSSAGPSLSMRYSRTPSEGGLPSTFIELSCTQYHSTLLSKELCKGALNTHRGIPQIPTSYSSQYHLVLRDRCRREMEYILSFNNHLMNTCYMPEDNKSHIEPLIVPGVTLSIELSLYLTVISQLLASVVSQARATTSHLVSRIMHIRPCLDCLSG